MVVAGNELQELPYGPGGHPDPRGALEEDCSSTVNYVLYRSGVRPIEEIVRDNPLAQDYVSWGDPGPGRWVTIYATDVPHAARVHRDRGAAAGHEPQRHRRRAEPQRRRPALADPRPHSDLGALVGPPSAGVVRCRAMAAQQGRLPADRRRPRVRELRALAARGRRGGRDAAGRAASPTRRTTARTARRAICAGRRVREEPFFRPNEWWGEQDIELLTRTSVTALDLEARTAKLSSKEEIEFDKALIATGRERAPAERGRVRARADPLPADAGQLRRDPRRAWRTPRRWC